MNSLTGVRSCACLMATGTGWTLRSQTQPHTAFFVLCQCHIAKQALPKKARALYMSPHRSRFETSLRQRKETGNRPADTEFELGLGLGRTHTVVRRPYLCLRQALAH